MEGGAELVAVGAEAAGDAALASGARSFAVAVGAKVVSAAAKGRELAGGVAQGIYKFATTSGKDYIGKSVNLGRRLAQHIRGGKLTVENFKSVVAKAVAGANNELRAAEQNAIDDAGGIGNLDNVINAVAKKIVPAIISGASGSPVGK